MDRGGVFSPIAYCTSKAPMSQLRLYPPEVSVSLQSGLRPSLGSWSVFPATHVRYPTRRRSCSRRFLPKWRRRSAATDGATRPPEQVRIRRGIGARPIRFVLGGRSTPHLAPPRLAATPVNYAEPGRGPRRAQDLRLSERARPV